MSNLDLRKRARRVMKEVNDLPTLPVVYHKLCDLLNSNQSSVQDIANVLGKDQSLTTKILRLVNSAVYGLPTQIESLGRAVTIIGYRQIKDLVLAASVLEAFKDSPAGKYIDLESFWQHTMAVAVCSKKIAMLRKESSPETFFTAGLLHDLGKLLIYQAFDEEQILACFEDAEKEGKPARLLEEKHFGLSHCDFGAELFAYWNLPVVYGEVASFHHRPNAAVAYPMESYAVHVADIVSHLLNLGGHGENFIPYIEEDSWREMSLSYDQLEELCEFTYQNTQVAMKIFFA